MVRPRSRLLLSNKIHSCRMDLKGIVLSERATLKRLRHCMIPLTWRSGKGTAVTAENRPAVLRKETMWLDAVGGGSLG